MNAIPRQSATEVVRAMRPMDLREARLVAPVVAAAAKRIETGSEENQPAA